MKKKLSIFAGCILVFTGIIAVCLSGTLFGREERYEVRNEIATPVYRTDVDRVMDAYQQLMNNYIRLTESNLTGLTTNVKDVQTKLDAMTLKMNELSAQLDRIEKHLGIEPPKESNAAPTEKQAP